jgi:hypothetical protein
LACAIIGRRLGEPLDIVRRHVEAGTVSGETLVLLFRVVECPGCGRPVPASAVRCRSCGTLLV